MGAAAMYENGSLLQINLANRAGNLFTDVT
jgi:hypothetical protein